MKSANIQSIIETNSNDNVPSNIQSKKPPNTGNNQPQKKPSVSAIDKKERKLLWQSLAKYCDALIEEARTNGYVPTHRFVHPQNMSDNFIKLGLRPPNNPRGLEKFYDNFITRCNYLADNNKNAKNKSKNPPKKWMPKGNRSKYTKKRGLKHLKVPHSTRSQTHNKIGSFPIASQSIQHHYHQYHINKNNPISQQQTPYEVSNKKQLRSELPAPHMPRNPKIYSNSLTLLQRKKFGPHIIGINNAQLQQMEPLQHIPNTIQIPVLQNEQMTPDQLMAQYHAQMTQIHHQQQQAQQQAQQQRQRVVYNAAHDHYYHINVGTPSSQQQQQQGMKRRKSGTRSLPNKQMNHAAKQHMYRIHQKPQIQMEQSDIKDDSSNSNESNNSHHSIHGQMPPTIAVQQQYRTQNYVRQNSPVSTSANPYQRKQPQTNEDQSYLQLRDANSLRSMNSSQGGNDIERPALSDKLTGNTDASHFSHSYNSDSDKEQNIQSIHNIALRIDTARTADIIPIGLPHNVSRYQQQMQQVQSIPAIYHQSSMGSRTPIPIPQSALYHNASPSHARSQSMDINYRKKTEINAVLQQQYLEFNQLSPINANQAVRTFSRQQHITHNCNKYSENRSPITGTPVDNNQMLLRHNFGLQTVSELKEETPNNQRFVAQYSPYSPVSPMYNVNGVTVGIAHHSQDSTSSLSNYSSLITPSSSLMCTPKITPSGHTISTNSFFSPTSQTQYDIDERAFDTYTQSPGFQSPGFQSPGFQSPASPYMMQTLYEDNSMEHTQAGVYYAITPIAGTAGTVAESNVDQLQVPQVSTDRQQLTSTPFYTQEAVYHTKNSSLNITQNNLIRSKLLDAQMVIDSNASGVSQWSAISTLSAVSAKSDDVITIGFINTDGQQVRLLFEYLQCNVKEAILLDLNAVRSRSSSMASINMQKARHSMKQSVDDLQGMVFITNNQNQTDNTLTPFELTPNTCTPQFTPNACPTITPADEDTGTFTAQMASFAARGVTIIDENVSCKPVMVDSPELNSSKSNSKSSGHSSKKSSSGHSSIISPAASPGISNRNRQQHSHHGSMHVAPHNDLDGLVIFEPVKTFEILDLYRSQTNDEVFLSVRSLFEKTLQAAFVGCVKYLRHRLKHTVSQIKYVFFVSFAMPNPNANVNAIWYELCKLRMEHIVNTVRQCQLACDQSKMKPRLISCITPIDPNSFSDKTPVSSEGDIYKNNDDFLANYHFPDYVKYQSYLPFINRIDLSQYIRKTLKPQIKFEETN